MKKHDSGLYVAKHVPTMWVKKFYEQEKVVTLKNGKRARIWVDDSGTVKQTETDDRLDATVQPRSVSIQFFGRDG